MAIRETPSGSSDPMRSVTFRCGGCKHQWSDNPGRVEDCADETVHPWRYFATCPECGAEAEQAYWERNLLRAWANATGPRTPEGKAASAKNLEGHPTPEEAERTRFNALKHGMNSRVATFWPAKPGRYPDCEGCEYLGNGCGDVHRACLKKTELFLRHHVAFTTRNPKLLTEVRADLQANLTALMNSMILAVIRTGVEIRAPEYYVTKEGLMMVAQYVDHASGELRTIEKISAHPLLKVIAEMVRNNTLSLADLGMTERVQEDQEVLRGHLDDQSGHQESALEYQRRQAAALEGLRAMIEDSRRESARDPVLIEHQAGEAAEGAADA